MQMKTTWFERKEGANLDGNNQAGSIQETVAPNRYLQIERHAPFPFSLIL